MSAACAEAVFETTRSAIVFALHYSTEQYGETVLGKLLRKAGGSGKGLVGLDGAGQAGMVLAAIWRLKWVERAAIVARFSPRHEPCACCGGQRPARLWRDAVEQLADWCVPAGVSNIRCRRELVAKHFGSGGIEFVALAEKYAMNRKTVAEHYRTMGRALADVESVAQMSIDEAFRAAGMVQAAA